MLAQVIVVLGILGAVFAGVMHSLNQINAVREGQDLRMMLEMKRNEIANEITNAGARLSTVKMPENYEVTCTPTSPPTPPPTGCGTEFRGLVHFRSGTDGITTVVNSLDPKSGITYNGQPCTEFDAAKGNDACPIRIEITWSGACKSTGATGACKTPTLFYRVNFIMKSASNKHILRIEKYNFDESIKQTSTNNDPAVIPTETLCANLGGTWVTPASPRPAFCVMPGNDDIDWY